MPAVLSVLAHPDDAEILCAGTLIRLSREHGWDVHIASMTAGDCGSVDLSPTAIATVRRSEGQQAAALIGATYHCLEERDLLIFYNEATLDRVTRLLRSVQPTILITHSPADYMLDHEVTSVLARAASFAAPAPNFHIDQGHGKALAQIPYLYYCDPIEGKDALGRAVDPSIHIDISGTIELKAAMLSAHASQREWLRKHHGMDHYVESMRDWSRKRGQEVGMQFAEGFRQHLGHGYPQEDLLSGLLAKGKI